MTELLRKNFDPVNKENYDVVPSGEIFTVSSLVADGSTAANYGIIFIAPRKCKIIKISEVHTTAGTDAGAVTLSVERLQGTEAPDAGDDLLGTTKIDLKGAINTVQSPALTSTTASLELSAGDRLCLKDTGVLTDVAGVGVTIQLKWID